MTTNKELKRMVCGIADDILALCEGTYSELNDDGDPMTLWDYLTDVYSVQYVVNADKSYDAVRLMVACGGPNIFIDTFYGEVQGYWGSSKEVAFLSRGVCDEIDGIWEEYYNCL